MANAQLDPVIHRLRHLFPAVEPDSALLERFVRAQDESAFALLMLRHGAMVLGLCRGVLRHHQDAEDAFQATFLALVRKAGSIAQRESLGGWLHKVAYRVALGARSSAAKRAAHERPLVDIPSAPDGDAELWRLLRAEVDRLPDKYRLPIVLCHLEGKTIDEAARALGCPPATVGTRLARARARLRSRLGRRGVILTGGAVAAALSEGAATAAVPTHLVAGTLRNAALLASGRAAAISTNVLALTEGALNAMFLSKMKVVALVVMIAALCSAAAGWTYRLHAAQEPTPPLQLRVEAQLKGDKQDKKGKFAGWGKAVDPDGDCKFTLDQGNLTIKIPGKDHALAFERNQMNAPRVLRDVEGDFVVQVKVSGDYPAGAMSVVETRRPFHGSGLLVWSDEKNYIRLERAELVSGNDNVNYASWELRQDGKFERIGNTGDLPLTEKEYYLRIERRDGKFYSGVSSDGIRWTAIEPIAIDLPRRLQVGVAAGHNTSSGFEAHFSEFKLFRETK